MRLWDLDGSEIAVVGMAGRFPGALNLEEYWRNLREGVESVRFFSRRELEERGVRAVLLDDPAYVPAASFLEGYDLFDAAFFEMSHREAEITDPQHRVALECAWEALENAGYDPAGCPGAVGVFVGATINTYLLLHLTHHPDLLASLEPVQVNIGNGLDFLATRISYKLNLKGPAYTLQSACSTSLAAVHVACQALHAEECDMALAGGISINLSLLSGYRHVEGGMASPDGRCRPFDARAQGTLFGSGAGLVVLKRLDDALAYGDSIRAVIKGSALNNDGSLKVGYTAPSVEGQARAIAEALADAGVGPETIQYVEAHGTATPLGDPIEIEALTQAFRMETDRRQFCAVGSVKGNIGHLDAAAGIAGFIKTVLALENREIPPSLHFTSPNPRIAFAESPFWVNAGLCEWRPAAAPRRAGVSAFGVGGTNAHVILQETPPVPAARTPGRTGPPQLLVLSARTPTALEAATAGLASFLERRPDLDLADVAFTLQVGRSAFEHRRYVSARCPAGAVAALRDPELPISQTRYRGRPVAFLLPGQGVWLAGATADLYQAEPVFREEVDRCAELLRPLLRRDLRELLHPADAERAEAVAALANTRWAQPALFVVEHALAHLWMSWGIVPDALLGHSLGEYTAACLAEVFSLEDALAVVAERGRILAEMPLGAMLAVSLNEEELRPFLEESLAVAAINGPDRLVASGPLEAIADLERRLSESGVAVRRVETSHAFHSPMVEPAGEPLARFLRGIKLKPPQIPFISNVTGTWIRPEEASSPDYWVHHLRSTVRFGDGVRELFAQAGWLLLEVGPGAALTQLVRRQPDRPLDLATVASLPDPPVGDALRPALGKVWMEGAEIDWKAVHGRERRRRIALPTYPFERRRYWVQPGAAAPVASASALGRDPRDCLYLPSWKATLPLTAPATEVPRRWLALSNGGGFARALVLRLYERGGDVVVAEPGEAFARIGRDTYRLSPSRWEDHAALLEDLGAEGRSPDVVVHLWNLGPGVTGELTCEAFEAAQETGFYSLLALARAALDRGWTEPLEIAVLAEGAVAVTGGEAVQLARSTLEAPCVVLSQEAPHLSCRLLDLVPAEPGSSAETALVDRILAEFGGARREPVVALRGAQRWVRSFETVHLPVVAAEAPGKVCLVTGGLAEPGYTLAAELARQPGTCLALLEPADPAAAARAQIAALEDHGAEVLLLTADLADSAQVGAAVAAARERFGRISLVVHTARLAEEERSFRGIAETGREEALWQLGPRVFGLLTLHEALGGEPDLWFVNSSLSSVLGGVGRLSYVAANLFLDAWVADRNRVGEHWAGVNWDRWDSLTEEGPATFWAILAAGPGRFLVSTTDLGVRLRLLDELREEQRGRQGRPPGAGRHPRPALDTPYIAPSSELETALAEIWQEVLGMERIGVKDNFFELGGDSLIALQTVDRLKRHLGREVAAVTLYEGLTIRSLAELLSAGAEEAGGPSESEERMERVSRRQEYRGARRQLRQSGRLTGEGA